MRAQILAVGLLVLCWAAQSYAYDHWNDIRYSALLPDSTVTIRVENVSGAGVVNYALYKEGEVQEIEMTSIIDGPSTLTATVPGPCVDTRFYGFRLLEGEALDLMPIRIPDGTSPIPDDLTRISTDSLGDEVFGITNLDLVGCHMSFSGDSLYGSLTNAGGGFPVIQGLTFYGYLVGINEPGVADPDTVFGLMYTFEQAGIISPGLYKITGPAVGDLVKLGEIQVSEFPASNTLLLSCALADLISDPDFMSWYDPLDPVMDIAGFTQRITILGGPAEADRTPGGWCHLRELGIDPGVNAPPELSGFSLQGEGPTAAAVIDYSDADANCPVVSEMVFDDSISCPMYPQTLDYTTAVTYSTEPGVEPLASGSWTRAILLFSDDTMDTVTYAPPEMGVPHGDEPALPGMLVAGVSPNPAGGAATIEYVMPSPGFLRVEVFDIRGSLVCTVMERKVGAGPGRVKWLRGSERGDRVSQGIYFLRLAALGQESVVKLVLVD